MLIWLAMAGLTAAVVAALVWPLTRRTPVAAPRAQFDAAVYRDQLAELERDRARGAIGPARRKPRATRCRAACSARFPTSRAQNRERSVSTAGAPLHVPRFIVPLDRDTDLSLVGIAAIARPAAAGAARQCGRGERSRALVARVEAHLAKSPGDVAGWQVLAPVYRRMERYDDAANAYARILSLGPADRRPSRRLCARCVSMPIRAW